VKKAYLAAIFCLIFSPVSAQEANRETLCRLLPEYKPVAVKPAEGVDYVAGVDVHGNPVISADLNAPLPAIMQPVVLPVDVDLAQRFHLTLPAGVELKPSVAMMRIHADGRAEYNGQDISDQAYALCGRGEGSEKEQKTAPIESGQPQADAVPSGEVIQGQYP